MFSKVARLAVRHALVWGVMAFALLAFTGCASLPDYVDRPVSTAIKPDVATSLGELAKSRRPTVRPGYSGFTLIDSADSAYSSRLALTQQAEKTLDIQYYAIHSDPSTAQLLRAVRQAAARGVRVRILLDDFHSTGKNAQIMRMAFVPGVEMRMFNPLPGGRGSGTLRALGSLNDFMRIQHRMHNKLYIADNAWGITGGRNLGDAYFGHAQESNFIDMDVLAAGAIVQDMSASFDRYWNDKLAYPVPSLITSDELKVLRETATSAEGAPVDRKVIDDLPAAMDLKTEPLIWASAALLVDKPAKLVPEENEQVTEKEQDTVIDGLLSWMQQARQEVLIVSPYFVPGPKMMEFLAAMRARGVRIRILTNSLASNDAPLAHVGYARYREDLIKMGAELHEMRALQREMARTVFGSSGGGSKASLHAKLIVIDGRLISIGSMNLDLRSQLQNSEVALLIRSRALSSQATKLIEQTLDEGAWKLKLDENDGDLVWQAPPGADFDDARTEPDASRMLRLILWMLGPLAPDEML